MDLQDSLGLAFFTIVLTLFTNIGFKFLQNKFDFMVDTQKFKREHYYSQLKELYTEAYAIVAQSEFLRTFHSIDQFGTLKEIPFLEVQKILTNHKKDLFTGETLEANEEIVVNAIAKFNKIGIAELVIKKKEFASQNLLKLAVAYRYVHEHYLNDKLVGNQVEKFQIKELELIYKIVTTIIYETNNKLKECKMDYNKIELEKRQMDKRIFNT